MKSLLISIFLVLSFSCLIGQSEVKPYNYNFESFYCENIEEDIKRGIYDSWEVSFLCRFVNDCEELETLLNHTGQITLIVAEWCGVCNIDFINVPSRFNVVNSDTVDGINFSIEHNVRVIPSIVIE